MLFDPRLPSRYPSRPQAMHVRKSRQCKFQDSERCPRSRRGSPAKGRSRRLPTEGEAGCRTATLHGWKRDGDWRRVDEEYRRGAREAEGAPLLREYRVKNSIEGSNPSLSARNEKGAIGPLFHFYLRTGMSTTMHAMLRLPYNSGRSLALMPRSSHRKVQPICKLLATLM